MTELDARGFQVHFHALGDRAVREALDAIEAARAANGPTDGRHHLAHLQVVHPDDVPRFAALGATANIQPLWAAHEPQMDELTIPFLGDAALALAVPVRRPGAGRGPAGRGQRLVGVGSPTRWGDARRGQPARPAGPRCAEAGRSARAVAVSPRRWTAYTSGSAYVNHLDDATGTSRPASWPTWCCSTGTRSRCPPRRSPTPRSSRPTSMASASTPEADLTLAAHRTGGLAP